ncbi:MAG TPA: dienelactone hydrolase family protein [Acidimicrobiia bacterium]|nr:dienelactone hydrolase family protein [Acidimicrobiia bacterium]
MAALVEGPHDATVERIVLDVDGHAVDAIHARPTGTALLGLVVAPDIGGLRPLFDDLCRRLATHGLAVCAVEPFSRIPADERAAMTVEDRLAGAKDLYDDVQLADLAEAADHLGAADGVPLVGVAGFCIGGYYALKAAATGRFERAVSFYGMIRTPDMWAGLGHTDPVDAAADACPTLFLAGDADPWVPAADVEALRARWAGRPDCKVLLYTGGVDHGFAHDPDRPAHRADDAADAWRHALAWLFETG